MMLQAMPENGVMAERRSKQAGNDRHNALATLRRASRSGDPTVAIAFGGGGARGIAHIHIIETSGRDGHQAGGDSGSSIGAIMGAAMASGMSGEEIREFTLGSIGKPSNAISRMWKAARPRGVRMPWRGS
jgi:NTE family protein